MQYADTHPNMNVIGVDIREPIIQIANDRVKRLGIPNLHFIHTNANINIGKILNDISKLSKVQLVTIQFPDPYFKKIHFKRRLVNDIFVQTLARSLESGCEVFFQSDVPAQCDLAVKIFTEASPWFVTNPLHEVKQLGENENLTGVMTEREVSVKKRNLNVFRMSFIRTDIPFDSSSSSSSSS